MELTSFIKDLWQQGSVTISGQITPFEADDLTSVVIALEDHYKQDILHVPSQAPAFHKEAGLWAACYLYRALQFVMLRDADNETILELLQDFLETKSPEVIYSADLSLRYLPTVFNFAKGLAPEDILVKSLKEISCQWPLSSVGMEISDELVLGSLMDNDSLRRMYIDRIIRAKDNKLAMKPELKPFVEEALGNYSEILWPGFQLVNR